MKKIKNKKCKVCKQEFTPPTTLARACSFSCALQLAQANNKKKFDKETRQMKKRLNDKDIKHQKDRAIAACNEYIRVRDVGMPCISCGTYNAVFQAGHYKTAGGYPELRFHPMNIHRQCSRCNKERSGNIMEYRPRLIQKIGLAMVEWLEGSHDRPKLTIDDYKDIKKHYKEQTKYLRDNPVDAWAMWLEE